VKGNPRTADGQACGVSLQVTIQATMVPVVGLLAGVGFAKMRFCFYPGYFTVFTEGIIEVVNEKEEQR
jgi:hypothetical protein